jgi:hypothetical protein
MTNGGVKLSIEPKRLAAVFFISRCGAPANLEEALHLAGASSVVVNAVGSDTPFVEARCEWAGMTCVARMHALLQHDVLEIRFWQSDFLAHLDERREPVPLEVDGALSVALTFREACESLQPTFAFLVTHLSDATTESILSREVLILVNDANALADARLGLLYLGPEIAQQWTPNPVRDDRDSLPVSSGRLVFAGRGWGRWF